MINQPTTDFSTLPPIMAIDFDGTLVEDNFPEIGKEKARMCELVRKLQKLGVRSILWTSRTGEYLDAAVEWCQMHDLKFDAVNENLPEIIALTGEDTRKVYANVYIDDKSQPAHAGLIWDSLEDLWKWLGK